MHDIFIRRACEDDLDNIFSIECEGLSLWNRKQFSDELDITFSITIVAEKKGIICGFAVIWIVTDEIQLHNISVRKDSRRSGIGMALLNYISLLKKNEMKKISIEANEKNLSALKFYEKMGFIRNGIRNKYYGSDSAILMELVL
jgi:ribosomal-protein-alanine N-acetyltransferase